MGWTERATPRIGESSATEEWGRAIEVGIEAAPPIEAPRLDAAAVRVRNEPCRDVLHGAPQQRELEMCLVELVCAVDRQKRGCVCVLKRNPKVVLSRPDAEPVPIENRGRGSRVIDEQVPPPEVGVEDNTRQWARGRSFDDRLEAVDVLLDFSVAIADPRVIQSLAENLDAWLGNDERWSVDDWVVVNEPQDPRRFMPVDRCRVSSREVWKERVAMAIGRRCRTFALDGRAGERDWHR